MAHIHELKPISMMSRAQPVAGELSPAAGAPHDIRWCALEELATLSRPMTDAVAWYCRTAIREISGAP